LPGDNIVAEHISQLALERLKPRPSLIDIELSCDVLAVFYDLQAAAIKSIPYFSVMKQLKGGKPRS
jgi:hypothetical protein